MLNDPKDSIPHLLQILSDIETVMKSNTTDEWWLSQKPTYPREHLPVLPYIQFYFLPEQQSLLRQMTLPTDTIFLADLIRELDVNATYEKLTRLLCQYQSVLEKHFSPQGDQPLVFYYKIRLTLPAKQFQKDLDSHLQKFCDATGMTLIQFLKSYPQRVCHEIQYQLAPEYFKKIFGMDTTQVPGVIKMIIPQVENFEKDYQFEIAAEVSDDSWLLTNTNAAISVAKITLSEYLSLVS